MDASETGGGDPHRDDPREIVEALTALIVSAEAWRRWSLQGPEARGEAHAALAGMLIPCDRIAAAVRSLLSAPDA